MTTPTSEGGRCAEPAERAGVDDTRALSPSLPEQLRRRRVASWRCEPLPSGLWDPWRDRHPDGWTRHELDAWRAAAEQLRGAGIYGHWQLPGSVRAAWDAA